MIADALPRSPKHMVGSEKPRIAPPTPARSMVKEYIETATELGIDLFPWQRYSGRYSYALGPAGLWLYPEVADIVSRQNGKTRPLVPFIVHRLKRMGRRIMHTAQNRELPREVFGEVAEILGAEPGILAIKGGRIVMPRYANGQEEIRLKNGGSYRIVAPTRTGARGHPNDDVIVDEVRELDNFDFIQAAKPTLTASANPQIHYLSNMGDETSVVLNALTSRSQTDPSLAYLEWSASPERAADDFKGWLEANPSIGHLPGILPYLYREYQTNLLQGTLAIFETEHLCRMVTTTRPTLVLDGEFLACEERLEDPTNPVVGVALDPAGKRASAVIAWARPDGTIGLRPEREYTGEIDVLSLAADVKDLARSVRAAQIGYSKATDAAMVVGLPKAQAVDGRDFERASQTFAQIVTGRGLRWDDAERIFASDLQWTARKTNEETRTFHAVRVKEDRPITSVQAGIRAVWLVSQRLSSGEARIY